MEQHTLKKCKQLFEYQHSLYLETFGGQSSDLYLNAVHFFMTSVNGTVHIRHQCRKTAVLSCHIFLISSGVWKMDHI
jgi:hypothetical protein